MLTTSIATATVTSSRPLSPPESGSTSPPFESRDSQSKLREILRDQSRREDHHQQQPTLETQPTTTSLKRQGSNSKYNPTTTTSSTSATSLSPATNGYFASTMESPQSRRDLALPHSHSTHLVDMYSNSQTSLSSHLQRERSVRQTYPENLATTPEIPPAGSKISRSQSTAGLSNGLDLKVVILGAQGVGKTSLVHRYTSGHFSASSVPSTIGASFLTKKLIVDGVKVRLQLWDTAGQERFRSMAPMYYRGSNAAVIVYDITNPSSFEDVKTWIDELRKNVHSDLIIHIVGSKADLAPHSRKVDLDDAREAVLSWTTPQQIRPIQPPVSLTRSKSAFGALRGNSILSSTSIPTSVSQNISPPSPSTLGNSNSRLGGFGGLTSLGSKSRLGMSPPSREGEEDAADADVNSSPSTSSSSGGGAFNNSNDKTREEQWDFIEVSEVSSKDNEGIEDVFVGIATRLVERKEEMEALAKSRQDRNSVFLSQGCEGDVNVTNPESVSWCCTTSRKLASIHKQTPPPSPPQTQQHRRR